MSDFFVIRPELYPAVAGGLEALKRALRWLAAQNFGPLDFIFEKAAKIVDGYTAAFLLLFALVGYGLSGFSLTPEALTLYDLLKDLAGLIITVLGAILSYRTGSAVWGEIGNLSDETGS